MQADLAEPVPRGQRAARVVLGEQFADQLVKTRALGLRAQLCRERAAQAAAARGGAHVDARLADARVAGAGAVGGDARPARDVAAVLRDEHGVLRRAQPWVDVGGCALLGLERRAALMDALVVDRGDRAAILLAGVANAGVASARGAHRWIVYLAAAPVIGQVSKT